MATNTQRHRSEMPDYPFFPGPPRADAALSQAETEQFRELGYVIKRGFFSREQVEQKRAAAASLKRAAEAPGSLQFAPPRTKRVSIGGSPWSASWNRAAQGVEGADAPGDALNPGRITYIDDVHALDATSEMHMRDGRLLRMISELLGDDIDAYQAAFVVKPAHTDEQYHGWHQDIVDYGGTSQDGDGAYGGMTNFGNVLTITYLSAVSPGHGSTKLAPRSHRTPDGKEGPVRPRVRPDTHFPFPSQFLILN